jgi:hypothetical protein
MEIGGPSFLALPVFSEIAIIWVCLAVAILFDKGQPALDRNRAGNSGAI